MEKPTFTVCLYHDGMADAFNRFVSRVWPAETSKKSGSDGPDQSLLNGGGKNYQKSPMFLFLRDSEVIGHIATLPVSVCCNSSVTRGHWVVGFMVLPEYRNGPIGPLLIKKVNETLPLALTVHVEEAALRIFKGMGWTHVGVIPQYIRVLDAVHLFKNIRIGRIDFLRKYSIKCSDWFELIISNRLSRSSLALLTGMAFSALSLYMALPASAWVAEEVLEEKTFDATYDNLWERVGIKFKALVVRDLAYLQARYGNQMDNYRLLTYRHNNALKGYCVVKIKQFQNDHRMGNTKMGSIVDCLFDPADLGALRCLFSAAVRLCQRERVDGILCTASHVLVQKMLLLNGFVKFPGNLNFAYHDSADRIPRNLSLDSWHLMRSDSDADQNF